MTYSGEHLVCECGRPSPTGDRRPLKSRSSPLRERLPHSKYFPAPHHIYETQYQESSPRTDSASGLESRLFDPRDGSVVDWDAPCAGSMRMPRWMASPSAMLRQRSLSTMNVGAAVLSGDFAVPPAIIATRRAAPTLFVLTGMVPHALRPSVPAMPMALIHSYAKPEDEDDDEDESTFLVRFFELTGAPSSG